MATQYMTNDGLEKAEKELGELIARRKDVADRIQSAKELGDLSENAEYAMAREDQAFLEGKIAELEGLLQNAVVLPKTNGNGAVVSLGSRITIQSDRGTQEYTIVGSNEVDPLRGKISSSSPLGQAFLGRKRGEVVPVTTPRGVTQYTITDIA